MDRSGCPSTTSQLANVLLQKPRNVSRQAWCVWRGQPSLRTLSLSTLSSPGTQLWAEEVSVFTREITAGNPLYHYHQQCRHTIAHVIGIMAYPLQNVQLKIKLKVNENLKDISYMKTFRAKTRSVAINHLIITTAELICVPQCRRSNAETDRLLTQGVNKWKWSILALVHWPQLTRSLHRMSNKLNK